MSTIAQGIPALNPRPVQAFAHVITMVSHTASCVLLMPKTSVIHLHPKSPAHNMLELLHSVQERIHQNIIIHASLTVRQCRLFGVLLAELYTLQGASRNIEFEDQHDSQWLMQVSRLLQKLFTRTV